MTDDLIRERARELLRAFGPNRAARALGIARDTLLSLAADAPVQDATFSLVRENLASRVVA